MVTSDPDWEAKWNTPSETTPHFREASKVLYGERLTILTFFGNPKPNKSNEIDIVCNIKVIRPDGSLSMDQKGIACASGKLQGDPRNVRLTSAVISFIGEKGDLPGVWKVDVSLTDRNRKVVMPLKGQFELVEKNPATGFQSQEDVTKWSTFYYLKPEPDRIPEFIEHIGQSEFFDNENTIAPIAGFLAGVFRKNPQQVDDWIDRLSSIKEARLGVVVLGLWYADLPDSQKRVYAILEKHPKLKQQFEYLYHGSPMPVEKIPLEQGAWVLDTLWGNFMATGDKTPVVRIMSALPWFDVKGDVGRLVIGGAARWSLTSNAVQHKRVLQICETEIGNQPKEVAEKLREVIGNAKKELRKMNKKVSQPTAVKTPDHR